MRAMYAANLPPVLTIAVGFSGGILVSVIPGWINGTMVSKIKVPPFISTLGMGYVVYGVALLISRGQAIADQPIIWVKLGTATCCITGQSMDSVGSIFPPRRVKQIFSISSRSFQTWSPLRLL